MREFIKKCLLLTVLIIYAAYLIPVFWNHELGQGYFLLQLLFVSVLLCALQRLTSLWKCNWFLMEMFVEYLAVLVVVILLGLLFRWFGRDTIWFAFCYVTPVYIAGYFLGLSRVKRDVKEINEKILQRKKRKEENLHGTDGH